MGEESTMENHQQWAGGYYCGVQHAGFEPQEAEQNDGECPWCGQDVEVLVA